MSNDYIPQDKDPHLWDIARRRAAFKKHLAVYFIMSAFFWLVWYATGARNYGNSGVPWPVWPMLGWGIGIAFNYYNAYVNNFNAVEDEYNKLTNNKNQTS